MGILHHRKYDWSETLYKAYYWNDEKDKEELEGFALFDKPYTSQWDLSKNSTNHLLYRNAFNDDNFFDDTTSISRETFNDRI